MNAISFKPSRNILLIVMIAFAIFIGGIFLLHVVPLAVKDKIADGLLADFVITFPILYYFIIIRPLKTKIKSLFLVLSGCCIIAYLVLPQHQKDYILQIRKLTIIAEVFIIVYSVTKFKKLRSAYNVQRVQFADPVYNLRNALVDVMGNSLAVKVLSSEIAILRYGLLFWKKEKNSLKESVIYSTHKESGYIAIWCTLLFAAIVEIVAFHFLLRMWSNTAAAIVTILSIYGTILFIADLSAIIKRKVIVSRGRLILRTGLRWKADTHLNNIGSVKKVINDCHSESTFFKGGVLKSSGNILITFKEPVRVDKLYGVSREFTSILMNIDNYESFEHAINVNL